MTGRKILLWVFVILIAIPFIIKLVSNLTYSPPRWPCAGANADIKNAYTAAQAYFTDYPDNKLNLAALRSYGFRSSFSEKMFNFSEKPDTIKIVSPFRGSLKMISFHEDCKRVYFVHPDGEIEILERSVLLMLDRPTGDISNFLKDTNPVTRISALLALGWKNDDSVIEPSIHLLTHEKDPNVRKLAVESIVFSNNKRAIEAVIGAYYDKDVHVQRAAVKALAATERKKTVETLIKALKDDDWVIREAAATAFIRIKDKRAVTALIDTLKDASKDEYVMARRAAVDALAGIPDSRAVQALNEALKDEDNNVRRRAWRALKE